MAGREGVLERVDAELAAGRLWRAKEILRGRIANGAVDPAVFERYGQLLEQTGDRLEAGKYLFLSGVRRPEYAPAIELFWSRHAKRTGKELAGLLPTAVRHQPLSQLPQAVRDELSARGVYSLAGAKPAAPSTWPGHLGTAAGMVVLFTFALALLIGLVTMASWLWARLGRVE